MWFTSPTERVSPAPIVPDFGAGCAAQGNHAAEIPCIVEQAINALFLIGGNRDGNGIHTEKTVQETILFRAAFRDVENEVGRIGIHIAANDNFFGRLNRPGQVCIFFQNNRLDLAGNHAVGQRSPGLNKDGVASPEGLVR